MNLCNLDEDYDQVQIRPAAVSLHLQRPLSGLCRHTYQPILLACPFPPTKHPHHWATSTSTPPLPSALPGETQIKTSNLQCKLRSPRNFLHNPCTFLIPAALSPTDPPSPTPPLLPFSSTFYTHGTLPSSWRQPLVALLSHSSWAELGSLTLLT